MFSILALAMKQNTQEHPWTIKSKFRLQVCLHPKMRCCVNQHLQVRVNHGTEINEVFHYTSEDEQTSMLKSHVIGKFSSRNSRK